MASSELVITDEIHFALLKQAQEALQKAKEAEEAAAVNGAEKVQLLQK